MVETINVAMTPRQPLGMTPSALAMNADQTPVICGLLRRQCGRGCRYLRSAQLACWDSCRRAGIRRRCASLADGRLVVLNGRGLRSYPESERARTRRSRPTPVHVGGTTVEYVGRIRPARLPSSIRSTTSNCEQLHEDRTRQFAVSRRAAGRCRRSGQAIRCRRVPAIPRRSSTSSTSSRRTAPTIRCWAISRKGNGDPSLVLFGENVTPNHHKLAREFVLLDNFYVNSDVSADGHNWSTAAIAPDYVQKMWPNSYAGRRKLYDYEGSEPASAAARRLHLDQRRVAPASPCATTATASTTSRSPADGRAQIASVRDPVLAKVTNHELPRRSIWTIRTWSAPRSS